MAEERMVEIAPGVFKNIKRREITPGFAKYLEEIEKLPPIDWPKVEWGEIAYDTGV
jgi:hypothetical protein